MTETGHQAHGYPPDELPESGIIWEDGEDELPRRHASPQRPEEPVQPAR
jgi:hypothetical protein